MKQLKIYFTIHFCESMSRKNDSHLGSFILEIAKNKLQNQSFIEKKKIELTEEEVNVIEKTVSDNYNNDFFLIQEVKTSSINIFVEKQQHQIPASLTYWEINSVAITETYNCLCVLSATQFVCEDPKTHEVILLTKNKDTKVFVFQD